jgi:hypothetical protein
MPIAGHIVALAVAGLIAGATWSDAPPSEPRVSCDQIILQATSGRYGGRRVLLGVVSAPQAYRPQVVASGSQRWPYWSKAGLVIRADSRPVRVSVHKAWRDRAAIEWGGSGIFSSLQIESCPAYGRAIWNAYSGGFHLRSPTACVPLIFSVGQRSKIVRFGLGRACSATS